MDSRDWTNLTHACTLAAARLYLAVEAQTACECLRGSPLRLGPCTRSETKCLHSLREASGPKETISAGMREKRLVKVGSSPFHLTGCSLEVFWRILSAGPTWHSRRLPVHYTPIVYCCGHAVTSRPSMAQNASSSLSCQAHTPIGHTDLVGTPPRK